jgi:hypothetical protein
MPSALACILQTSVYVRGIAEQRGGGIGPFSGQTRIRRVETRPDLIGLLGGLNFGRQQRHLVGD